MNQTKLLKRVLSAALALSLVMAPAITAGATETPKPVAPVQSEAAPEVPSAPATNQVTMNGQVVKSALEGAYLSASIPAAAVVTGKAAISESYGLAPGEKPYVRTYDITEKGSPMAMASLNAAAEAVGGKLVGAINMEIGKIAGHKFSLLEQGGAPIAMTFGIPKKSIVPGYTYALVCVRPGGAIEILPDNDTDDSTVTFVTSGGLGAYAIVMYPTAG